MKISLTNKYIQPQHRVEPVAEQSKAASVENKGVTFKNKVDSAEISSGHSGTFEDKRLMVAKSAILYDVSVGSSPGRIAELKAAVENGSYKVPTNDLAETILKE